MSDSNSPLNPGDKWRTKYAELIKETEQQEALVAKKLQLSGQLLSITASTAMGQNNSFDSSLKKLKSSVLNMETSTQELEVRLDELSKAVNNFDREYNSNKKGLVKAIELLASTLLKMDLSEKLSDEVKLLQHACPRDLESWGGYINQLSGWAELLRHVLQENPISEDTSEELCIADELSKLISELIIPEKLTSRSVEIREALSSSADKLLPETIKDFSTFLVDCLNTSQSEFKLFLKSLDQRLEAIKSIITKTSATEDERRKARVTFEESVQSQISDLGTRLKELGDIGEVGDSIQSHLVNILSSIQQYNNAENQREQILRAELQEMEKRLMAMELESEGIREMIEHQKREATTDYLTQLPNRSAYDKTLREALKEKATKGTSLALVVCDIDHFKRINDTYGHLVGDKVLKLLANVLRKSLRAPDFLARFGGEEFVAIIPNTSMEHIKPLVEKLRKNIEKCPFHFSGKRVTITMSFGITEFKPGESHEAAFERADQALYQAKENGRNQSIIG